MKQRIKSILALLMLVCIVFTAAGCGGNENNDESEKVAAGDDFFTETLIEDESNAQDGDEDSDKNTTSNNSSASSSKDDSGNKTQNQVADVNKISGKTWKEVLASMPKKLRGSTLVVYNWNAAAEYTGAPAVMEQFTKQTGIKVEWRVTAYSEYFTKLAAIIASGDNIPDVARTLGPVPNQMLNFQPLSTVDYDFSDEAWDKSMMDMYTVGDNVYATSLKNTHIGAADMMFYNKDLIDKYDYEDPYKLWKNGKWTWEKFLSMAEEYHDETGNFGAVGERWSRPYITAQGISGLMSFNGKKFTNTTNSSKFINAYQILGDLYNKKTVFGRGQSDVFNSGKALFCTGGAVHLRRKNSYFGSLKGSNSLYAVPMPTYKDNKKYYQGAGEAEAYAIVNGAKNAEAVPYFLRYFLDGANYELNTYFCNKQNLEVYNWCMNQENRVFFYSVSEYSVGLTKDGLEYKTAAQVKNHVDAKSGVVDKVVKEYNEDFKKLMK